MALEQVNTVTLPAIFREIGCWLGKTKKAPPASFQHHFDALAVLKPAAESKNPQAIGRLDDVYVALGREAYEKYGDKAVPKEIAPHLAAALSKRWEYLAILERAGKATDNALDPPRSAARVEEPRLEKAKQKGRFRRAFVRVLCAFAGAMLVFCVSVFATQGLLGSLQGLIDYFQPVVIAVLVSGLVFLFTSQVWKLVRRWWAGRYAATPLSAFFFGACLAVAALVLFEGLLANLRLSETARLIVQIVFVVLTSIAAVEAESIFLRLFDSGTGKNHRRLIALLLASTAYARKKASLTKLYATTFPGLHYRMGKQIASLAETPSGLEDGVAKIRRLEESLAVGGAASVEVGDEKGDAKPSSFANKVVGVVGNVKAAAKQFSRRVQLNAACVWLGRQAVEKFGEKAPPQELQEELFAALHKAEALRAEVDALSKSARIGICTPGRLAFGGAAVALLLLFIAGRTFSGASSADRSASAVEPEATSSRTDDTPRQASSNSRTNDVDPGVAFLQVLMGMAAQQQAQQSFSPPPPVYAPRQPAFGGYGVPPMHGNMQTPASTPASPPQQWEGTCTRCGWTTGRQFFRASNRCIQMQGGGSLCRGVIVWAPAQGR